MLVVLRSHTDTTQDPQVPGSFILDQLHDSEEHQARLKPRPPKGSNLGGKMHFVPSICFHWLRYYCKVYYILALAMRNADGSAHVELGPWHGDSLSGWISGRLVKSSMRDSKTKEGTVIFGKMHFKISNSFLSMGRLVWLVAFQWLETRSLPMLQGKVAVKMPFLGYHIGTELLLITELTCSIYFRHHHGSIDSKQVPVSVPVL